MSNSKTYNISPNSQLWFYRIWIIIWLSGLAFWSVFGKEESFLAAYHLRSIELDKVFPYITYLGDGWFCLAVFLALGAIKWRTALDFLFIFLIGTILVHLGKQVLFSDALRPLGYFGSEIITSIPGVSIHERNAFPSGHSTTAMMCFFFLGILAKKNIVKILWIVPALLAGFSRIYLGQHFVEDVLAGFFLGAFATLTWLTISNRIKWGNWSEKGWMRSSNSV